LEPITPQVLLIAGSIGGTLVGAVSYLFRQLLAAKNEQIDDRDKRIIALEATVVRLEAQVRRATSGFERVVAHRKQNEDTNG
jgi:hypothetical protein